MPEVTPGRVMTNAAAARVHISEASAERVAAATSPAVERIANAGLQIALETEPATFMAIQQREMRR